MASFYEKLSAKLQEERAALDPKDPPSGGAKGVSFNAAGARTAGAQPQAPAQNAAPNDPPADPPAPEGADPLTVDLFQSDASMVIFVQAAGVMPGDFEVTADEEENTLLIQATQKRPDLPPGTDKDKGRFVKKEIAWGQLYRKVYLPAPFDAGEADSYLAHGVLVVVLPVKKPGIGKKLSVRELKDEQKQ